MEETEKSTLQVEDQEFTALMDNYDILDINLDKARALADVMETSRSLDLHEGTVNTISGMLLVLLTEAYKSLDVVRKIIRMRIRPTNLPTIPCSFQEE